MTNGEDKQLVANVARDVVSQMAPQELPLFRATSEAYFKDPHKTLQTQSGKDEMLGFGTGEAVSFLTPIALAVMGEVIKYLFEQVKLATKAESAAWISDMVKAMFKKLTPTGKAAQSKPAALTPEQLSQVRQIVIRKARQLKLPDDKARTLADTVIGGLAIA
jgi:hypothetical protein